VGYKNSISQPEWLNIAGSWQYRRHVRFTPLPRASAGFPSHARTPVRTALRPDDAPGVLELDWYLPLEPRIQKGVIVAALRRFAAAVTSALKADTRQILVTDQRVPRA